MLDVEVGLSILGMHMEEVDGVDMEMELEGPDVEMGVEGVDVEEHEMEKKRRVVNNQYQKLQSVQVNLSMNKY